MPNVTFEDLPSDVGLKVTTKIQKPEGGSARVVLVGGAATAFYDDGDTMVVRGVGTEVASEDDLATIALSFGDVFKFLKDKILGGQNKGMKCQGSTTVHKDGSVTSEWK